MSETQVIAPVSATMDVKALIPYFNNPRSHTDDAIDKMVESIDRFGFRVPVLIKITDEGPDVIDGHLRIKAAIKMGLQQVTTLDCSDMTDDQIRAFRIMVNRSVAWADWDDTKLYAEIQEIMESEIFEMGTLAALTGFDADELKVFEGFEPETTPVVDLTGGPAATTQGDMDGAAANLDSQTGGTVDTVEVVCPECANIFHIAKSTL